MKCFFILLFIHCRLIDIASIASDAGGRVPGLEFDVATAHHESNKYLQLFIYKSEAIDGTGKRPERL